MFSRKEFESIENDMVIRFQENVRDYYSSHITVSEKKTLEIIISDELDILRTIFWFDEEDVKALYNEAKRTHY